MKKQINILLFALIFAGITGCEKYWEEHYGTQPETVNESVWDAIKSENDFSKFVQLAEQYKLDTLFKYNDVYSVFVPTNQAITQFLDTTEVTEAIVSYHFLRHFIQPNNIKGKKKLQTLMLKFAQFENRENQYFFDNIQISTISPLYVNGRYFVIEKMGIPKPSLYEYIALNNPALKLFIDNQDSIILDKELSKPLGFDDDGNTIYDSIITVINLFEEEFFEVSTEFRLKTATLVFPKQPVYENALTNMALKLGGTYKTHEDIDMDWQQEILIPYLLENGVFENQREEIEFTKDTLKNILGDSVRILYEPTEKTICSNGYAYNYKEFEIKDSLFMSPLRNEGEQLLDVVGSGVFAWKEEIKVVSSYSPKAEYIQKASNDSILTVSFPKGYTGKFDVEFETKALFPRRYLVVVRTHMDNGGLYDIYINDQLVKTFNYYDFIRYKGVVPSVLGGTNRYVAVGRYCKFDFWVDNITEYGKARMRFEYKGPGTSVPNNGFFIDYVEFVPESMTKGITSKNP
jgi:uncharacterized surface protein with fasciclin (FAS1) repeats